MAAETSAANDRYIIHGPTLRQAAIITHHRVRHGLVVMESGHYLLPSVDLSFLFVATFGELFLLV